MERRTSLVLIFVMMLVSAKAAPKVEGEPSAEVGQSERDDKVFIALIKIPPDQCTTTDNTDTYGTCMPTSECNKRGGSPSGNCANSLGTCCLVKRSCSTETSLNNTYFVNPDAATGDYSVGGCVLTVNRMSDNICQIRLDFDNLHLSQPDINGNCFDDFFTVSGVKMVPNVICGKNSGQHMYLDVEPNGGAIRLTVDRSTSSTASRNWKVKVTQIACDSKYRAPEGCLQYYTATSGTVESFNYNPASSVSQGTPGSQLAKQNYGICIKKASGYCGIQWERDQKSKYSFTVSGDVAALKPDQIGEPSASSTGNKCKTDYIVIPEGVYSKTEQADRYCGLGFPTTVTSTAAPFVLYVRTDESEVTDGSNFGFKLHYSQTPSC